MASIDRSKAAARWNRRYRLLAACGLIVLAGLAAWRTGLARRVDSNALWRVVHNLCVPDEASNHSPTPCVAVDLAKGYAVLRDERGATQVLVIPTAKVTGIEDPAVLKPDAPNYWQDAWDARQYVEQSAHRPIPRDDIGLAINSLYGRSQNQLHIHVDCLDPYAKRELDAALGRLGPAWVDRVHIRYRDYRALWIPEASLATTNLFRRAVEGDPAARRDMSRETLALLPETSPSGARGFVLLEDRASIGYEGHAENLLDHKCRFLTSNPYW
ncbi:MAG TPA: CDP-diacylglycerol diphosphatase [Caulobacteraceae bacterium]|nr:CDP-diacylglycerol diphosphatase [Caulobacteraceae bacterium]